MCVFFPQKESGAETSSFYSALLRIQPKIVHCWRPMRRTFKAYDEGGTGLLSVADFRKVSSTLGCLLRLNREQWPNANGQKTSKEDPSPPWQRPRCEQMSGTPFPWGPQVITCPSPSDPRFSSLKVSRTLGGTRPEPSGYHHRCHWSREPRLGPWSPWGSQGQCPPHKSPRSGAK